MPRHYISAGGANPHCRLVYICDKQWRYSDFPHQSPWWGWATKLGDSPRAGESKSHVSTIIRFFNTVWNLQVHVCGCRNVYLVSVSFNFKFWTLNQRHFVVGSLNLIDILYPFYLLAVYSSLYISRCRNISLEAQVWNMIMDKYVYNIS